MNKDPFKEYIIESEPGKGIKDMLGIQQLVYRLLMD